MARVELSVEIARPPEQVFGYLTDVAKVREWQPATEEVRLVTEGPTRAGTRYVQVLRLLGRRIESAIEVTEHEPPRRFAIRTSGGPVSFDVAHLLEPLGDGSRTLLRVEGEGKTGGLFKLGEGVAVRAAERELRKSFERLKAVLEAAG